MKTITILFVLLTLSFYGYGQDTVNEKLTEASETEVLYKRQKTVGAGGAILGGVGLAISIPFLAVRTTNYHVAGLNGDERKFEKVAGPMIGTLLGAAVLGFGISSLMKSKETKSRMDNGGVSLNPVLLNDHSFNGANINLETGLGIRLSYSF